MQFVVWLPGLAASELMGQSSLVTYSLAIGVCVLTLSTGCCGVCVLAQPQPADALRCSLPPDTGHHDGELFPFCARSSAVTQNGPVVPDCHNTGSIITTPGEATVRFSEVLTKLSPKSTLPHKPQILLSVTSSLAAYPSPDLPVSPTQPGHVWILLPSSLASFARGPSHYTFITRRGALEPG